MSDVQSLIDRLEHARAYLQLSAEAMRELCGIKSSDAVALYGGVGRIQRMIDEIKRKEEEDEDHASAMH